MATAEQIKSLIRSHFSDDTERFYTAVLQMAAHEARQGHTALAVDIRDIVDKERKKSGPKVISFPQDLRGLVLTEEPQTPKSALVIPPALSGRIERIIHEYRQRNKLKTHGLKHRRKILLIGPPGTGKTSQALQHIVAEELTEPNASVLLLAYTNRATDEICAMLVDSGIAARTPFIRLGHELSTDPRFVPYLLRHHLDECGNMNDIKQQVRKTRIFVATTTTIGNQLPLFNLKHFTLAIFDEASQLLEPNIVGILSAMNEGRPVIDRFVLTGDYKQLPAVVQQNQEESEVEEPELRAIGLTNCRNSLFERLYKIRKDDRFTAILHHQGRMHPDVAAFPSEKFYAKEQLVTVPLKHQLEEKLYTGNIPLTQPLDHLVAEKRMLFFDAPATDELNHSDKCNPQEALIVTKVLESIYRLRQDEFDADRTVGVIVPYRNQIAMIRHEIEKLHIPTLQRITIDTVERYQGSQRDIIIYSFTIRASYQLDFLTANTFMEEGRLIDRKLNVVLTRARKQMILVGSAQLLRQNILFRQLIAYVEEKGGFMDQISE